MTDHNKPVNVHYRSAKEHLAGVHAAAKWYAELAAQHLLDNQQPIKDQPAAPTPGRKQ